MSDLALLGDLVVVFSAALIVVPLLHRLRVPPIAGFILAGVIVGPHALALIEHAHDVELLADLGVVLLLFGIGLELSLDRLRRLWRPILVGGLLQVSLTIAVSAFVASSFGLPWRSAVFVGFLVAVSSTAIVLRGLQARGEVDAPHGCLTLGILVFQDLCVVPMILLLPLLAGDGASPASLAEAFGKSVGVLAGVVLAAHLVVPRALDLVARTRQRDLFILAVFLACVGTAWIVSLAGISLALGAFLAGLVVAGSDYRHQALAELIPFREILTSLFFISVGMLFDPRILLGQPGGLLALVGAILLGKLVIVVGVGTVMQLPLRVSVLAAVALAQIGEFSFVLSRAASGSGLLDDELGRRLTAAAIITMLLTPLGLALGPSIAAGAGRVRWLNQRLGVASAAEIAETTSFEGHVIIAGYGVAGRGLATSLESRGVPYIIVDMNPQNVRSAGEEGHRAVFGDVTSPEVLDHLGLGRARELVIVISDPEAVGRAVLAARSVAPELYILARTRYVADVAGIETAGASVVVAEEAETAALISRTLSDRHAARADA